MPMMSSPVKHLKRSLAFKRRYLTRSITISEQMIPLS